MPSRRPPPRRLAAAAVLLLVIAAAATPARAVQTCDLGGEPVNPNNGATTAGKTGLMRCRDADSGQVVREQALRDGRFVGVVRHFKAGQLEREFSVDERGNRDGSSREWNVDAGGRRTLVREETIRDGRTVGLVRTWYPTGQRRRLAFDGDDGRVSTVVLVGARGDPVSRIAFERGERRRVESFDRDGVVRKLRETSATGSLLRRFAADGTRLHETRWVVVAPSSAGPAATGDARPRGVKVLEQEFHPTGPLVRETRWTPPSAGTETTGVYDDRGRIAREREFDEAGTLVRDDEVYEDGSRKALSK